MRHVTLLRWTGAFLLAVTISAGQTSAQFSQVLQAPETPQQPAEPTRSLEEWQSDVADRLRAAKSLAKEVEENDNEPAASVTRQIEELGRIDLTLGQLANERAAAEKNAEKLQQLQLKLDQLVEHGLRDEQPKSFRRLDELRDDLRAARRRLQRTKEKEKTAAAAFEKAQDDLSEKNVARRQAKEKSTENQEDDLRPSLGEQLAEAVRQSELADAVAQLRKQELANAKTATGLQELRVAELEETEIRLQADVKFGTEELGELLVELDRQEDDLKNRLASFESRAEFQLKSLENQWLKTQSELLSSSGDKEPLQEKAKAIELNRQVQKSLPPLLRMQLDRLGGDRTTWQHRQQVFNSRPARDVVRQWTAASQEAIAQLKREERTASFELEELKEQLDAADASLKKVEPRSLVARSISEQIAHLTALRNNHLEALNSIRTSEQLHRRLLSELAGDSLAATAKDQLHNLWYAVESIWNYELTSFGEQGNEKSITVQKVVTAVLILLAGAIFSRALSRMLGRQVLRRLEIDASAAATIQSLFYYLLLLMFGLFALNVIKVPLTAFTVLGGAVALGIGFGSQNIINNFISGLILLAERPVKVGDLIQLDHANGDSLYGNIEHIGARSTRVRTGSNLEIIVPNSSFLQNNVVNFTLSSDKVRTLVEVGVVYGSPTVTVTQLLRRAVIETGRVAKDPPPIILFKNFGDNSLVFEVHFWIRMRTMMDQMQIESAVRFRIDQLFREEGIVIAFPQRDVHLDSSSPLQVQMIESPDPSTYPDPST